MEVDSLLQEIENGNHLPEKDLTLIFKKMKEMLFAVGTIQKLSLPITICGDIHGQLYDLFELFRVSGGVENNTYLFLGDYVDRGYYSIETFTYLCLLKIKYPDRIILLRGNHESRQTNQCYGFYDEFIHLYNNASLWKTCNEVFDLLPLSALIEKKIFCVHGGLSPDIHLIQQISTFERQTELPCSGPISDLCWSDPDEIESWGINQRGAGWLFGKRPTNEFSHMNKLDLIVRAHQVAMDGYKYHFGEKKLITVWSAPNYMYRTGNDASVLKIDKNMNRQIVVFKAVENDKRVIPNEQIPHYFA
ncbi:Serine/threonine-protein phosphatase ppe1 [Histomonas meleagridis]|uniref:Serine/threonine-protein phosphatase ppe1 n=1 Tax=Histomonas meleagridis TaxID=135588 RepID=UPI00355ACD50|nr:Serine/threonine-protein phosphatase ppe1 [Histomonas meleagridis]KAH0802107.1 Serine/threonine-protein phosphatase ppe1 [Histomonas meleagridis]